MEIRIDAQESEEAILGAVFFDPLCFYDVAAGAGGLGLSGGQV